jgi:phosphoribosyl-ATP pyrophosphohydrolase/phosphoribosyl-AMP cyclohydrolase/histidinol dehydrogenase
MSLLQRCGPESFPYLERVAVDAETLAAASAIVEDVRGEGLKAVRAHGERLGDCEPGAEILLDRPAMQAVLDAIAPETRALLERTAGRIRAFAEAQRGALQPVDVPVTGGRAGHTVAPVTHAGCDAPGGRFPLPSSVLMTVVTARAAGVETVWIASPKPTEVTIAAAAVAGADGMLCVGGAEAIAALAFGARPVPKCDVVVGPGNRWVTAAKQLVSGYVTIDMLAGPSELVILADKHVDPATIAADLLAQAEHDDDALPVLVTPNESLVDAVEAQLAAQLQDLPTAPTARAALKHGFAVIAGNWEEAYRTCDRIAPEHLQIMIEDPDDAVSRLRHYGALFIGHGSAEVMGDYGAGPNHVLPTGGTARSTGGLSVLTFLRVRTWLRIADAGAAAPLARDAADLARLEGLEGHARAAERRL